MELVAVLRGCLQPFFRDFPPGDFGGTGNIGAAKFLSTQARRLAMGGESFGGNIEGVGLSRVASTQSCSRIFAACFFRLQKDREPPSRRHGKLLPWRESEYRHKEVGEGSKSNNQRLYAVSVYTIEAGRKREADLPVFSIVTHVNPVRRETF